MDITNTERSNEPIGTAPGNNPADTGGAPSPLIGQAIQHNTFGKGVVTNLDRDILTICFSGGEKRFLYPNAFGKYLTLKNKSLEKSIQADMARRTSAKRARIEQLQEEQERRTMLSEAGITPRSQAVFDLKPQEVEAALSGWTVSTGEYLSGGAKGEPRVPQRMKPNSLCVLTCRPADEPESQRQILGAFMVPEDFLGDQCRDGIIHAHPQYRLRLDAPVPFWPLITQDAKAKRWGRIAFKYVSIQTGEAILSHLVSGVTDPEDKAAAEEFYAYFCLRNHLSGKRREALKS